MTTYRNNYRIALTAAAIALLLGVLGYLANAMYPDHPVAYGMVLGAFVTFGPLSLIVAAVFTIKGMRQGEGEGRGALLLLMLLALAVLGMLAGGVVLIGAGV